MDDNGYLKVVKKNIYKFFSWPKSMYKRKDYQKVSIMREEP